MAGQHGVPSRSARRARSVYKAQKGEPGLAQTPNPKMAAMIAGAWRKRNTIAQHRVKAVQVSLRSARACWSAEVRPASAPGPSSLTLSLPGSKSTLSQPF